MRTAPWIGIASALIAISTGAPWVLQRHARLEMRAGRNTLDEQANRLSVLAADNERLAGLVAKEAQPLDEEQLRELMKLRNEKRWLAEQTNLMARRIDEEKHNASLATGISDPAQLSPDEIVTALSAEMIEAMKHILPALQPALQKYALDHTNQHPGNLSDLGDYLLMAAGRKMVGLRTFQFAREDGPKPGDALLLGGNVGRRSADGRPGEGAEVRVYGFSDGRVVEVSSEDGRFDAWEAKHMNSAPAGTEEKIYLEAEETARERSRIEELGASVGISAEDASRFFDRFKQEEKVLGPRFAELEKSLTGSPEERQRQKRAAIEEELTRLAAEILGDKGPALARKLVERK